MANYKEIAELCHSYLNETDSLCHFGIKGMKWGVRRFQNEDGSLTQEGKERYYGEYIQKQKINIKQASKSKEVSDAIKELSILPSHEELADKVSKAKKILDEKGVRQKLFSTELIDKYVMAAYEENYDVIRSVNEELTKNYLEITKDENVVKSLNDLKFAYENDIKKQQIVNNLVYSIVPSYSAKELTYTRTYVDKLLKTAGMVDDIDYLDFKGLQLYKGPAPYATDIAGWYWPDDDSIMTYSSYG